MELFTQRVIEIIKSIPAGYVMSYGQIAEAAGSPRGARQVVRILHSMSKAHELPWHRVVNRLGEIAVQQDESRFLQKLYLQEEGVPFDGEGRVRLEICRHYPVEGHEEPELPPD
ncbi:MGMT family protein [Paenibacillus sepulcri]|uniref:MGMT family protein n=1 Tax=Paenibacillus sepulcri TaxID=359917 RepID=A0ABS7C3D8_9BACL|nr:MGMT family protein [Paenibacillus sepulcri]